MASDGESGDCRIRSGLKSRTPANDGIPANVFSAGSVIHARGILRDFGKHTFFTFLTLSES